MDAMIALYKVAIVIPSFGPTIVAIVHYDFENGL